MVEGSGASPKPNSLSTKVSANTGLQDILARVYIVDTIDAALDKRSTLGEGESFITQDGVWVGRHWLQKRRFTKSSEGLLTRKQRLEKLSQRHATLLGNIARLKQDIQATSTMLAEQEQARDEMQNQHREAMNRTAQIGAEMSRCEEKSEQIKVQIDNLDKAEVEAQARREHLVAEHEQSQKEHQQAAQQITQVAQQFGSVEAAIADQEKNLQQHKDNVEKLRQGVHQIELEQENVRGACSLSQNHIEQLQLRDKSLDEQNTKLAQILTDTKALLQKQTKEFEALCQQQEQLVQQYTQLANQAQGEQQKIDTLKQQQQQLQEELERLQTSHSDVKASLEVARARSEDARMQFDELNVNEQEITERLTAEVDKKALENSLQGVLGKIKRLGAVNLVALEELEQEQQRKDEIDKQHQDLVTALATLEAAIQKIDHEVTGRFQQTFDRVNSHLKEIFPVLFAGGEAYLRRLDDESGEQGIAVMVKPPGKRLSSIQLMSGGRESFGCRSCYFCYL